MPLLISALSIIEARGSVESHRDLGHGFRIERHQELSNSSFESIGHFDYLYFEETNLGQCSDPELSPSGRYAFFQNSSGFFKVYDSWGGRLFRLTVSGGMYDALKWDEGSHYVTIIYKSGISERFKLK
jgi:hypothetical protein